MGTYEFCGGCKHFDKKKSECPKGIFNDEGVKIGAVCEKDSFLNNFYEMDMTDTLSYQEVFDKYAEMLKEFKGFSVAKESYISSYSWIFEIEYKGKTVYDLDDCMYKKLPPSRKNVESKIKKLGEVLKKRFKDIYMKELIESVSYKLRELDKDNKHDIFGYYRGAHEAGIKSDVDIMKRKVNMIYDIETDGVIDEESKLMKHCLKNKIFKSLRSKNDD